MAVPEDRLVAGYQAATNDVRSRVENYARTVWKSSPDYRDRNVERMIKMITPRVQAGQIQIANLTAAYMSQLTGTPLQTVDRAGILDARGVPIEEVYHRPASTVYAELAAGKTLEQAVIAGGIRLLQTVGTDIQMAKVRQSDRSLKVAKVRYYARVASSTSCALCRIASTQRYRTGRLMPIHPGCHCGIRAFRGAEDMDQVIDRNLLETTHGQVEALTGVADRGGRASDYRKLLTEDTHSEIGPMLTWASNKFTKASDLALVA